MVAFRTPVSGRNCSRCRQLGGDGGQNYVKEQTLKIVKYKVTEGTCEAHFGHCVAVAFCD